MKSNDGKSIQSDLLGKLGFSLNKSGKAARKDILAFQKKNGLKATGVLDAATIASIKAQAAASPVTLPAQGAEGGRAPSRAGAGIIPRLKGVPAPKASAPEKCVVRGIVADAAGNPLNGLTVKAFDRDLRGESALGAAVTGSRGEYAISYAGTRLHRTEKTSADLLVRVYDGKGAVLAASAVVFNAAPVETVDLTAHAPAALRSEYGTVLAAAQALLAGAALESLSQDDVAFLAGQTRIPALRIAFLSTAERHARATGAPAEAFYAFFRRDIPTALPSLLVQPPALLRDALTAAAGMNIVSAAIGKEAARIVEALQGKAGAIVLGAPGEPTGEILGAAGLSAQEQEAFLRSYVSHEGTPQEFWTALRSGGMKDKVDAAQDALRMGAVTGNNGALVSELGKKGVRGPRDLAALGADGLKKVIAASKTVLAAAPDAAGETPDQKAGRLAADVMEAAGQAFPTAFLKVRLEGGAADPVRRDAARILANAPGFELRDGSVDALLKGSPQVLDGVRDKTAAAAHLKTFQRVMRVAPQAEHADALVSAGFQSAREIAGMSPSAFVENFSGSLGGADKAQAYFNKARQVTDAVSAVSSMAMGFNDLLPQVIGPSKNAPPKKDPSSPKALPDLTTLFGSYSFCDCQECNSVYGPAAYLVDLLQFINPKQGKKPLDTLRARRPDIENIELTCENTNTVMPALDLANEILEYYVVNGKLTKDAARDTGDAPSDQLMATPQFVMNAAYDALKGGVYPPSLPFDLPLSTVRLYLENLAAPREAVMAAFQKGGAPSDADVALESLGISSSERDILTGADPHQLREFYGYGTDSVSAQDAQGNPVTENWKVNVARVPEFLRRTETTYDDLLKLVPALFVNSGAPLALAEDDVPPSCDLNQTRIVNLQDAQLGKIHRFLRLARKLGWALPDLDRSFTALQAADVTADFLGKLSVVQSLKEDLGLSLPDLFSFWSPLAPDLYASLFLNEAVINPPDPDFALNAAGTELQVLGKTLDEKTPALLAALRLSTDDLSTLRADAGSGAAGSALTLASLSALYRRTVLVRAVGIRPGDLVSLRTLTGMDPFQAALPAPTAAFVSFVRKVQGSSFSTVQLDYLYRQISAPAAPMAPDPAVVDAFRQQVADGLAKLGAAQGAGEISPESFIQQTLAGRLALDSDVLQVLLDDGLKSAADPTKPASADVSGLAAGTLTPENFRTLYERLYKASLLIGGFGITPKELAYLSAHAADFSGFDLNALPLDPAGFSQALFQSWGRLKDLFSLRDNLPQAGADLIDVFSAGAAAAALDALKKATGWDPDALDALAGPAGFALADGDFKNELRLLDLKAALDIARSLGVSCDKLFAWAAAAPDAAAAQDVVNAAKAKFDPTTWLTVAKPLNDSLRLSRRDALVSHLLTGDDMSARGVTDADQLFEYFLIDVESGTEVTTSRIAQAIASVQLFIQRCQMNLEPVSASLIDPDVWEWMKNYRVWEANRMVFLYPENWIVPELRDDKTPFFKDMETQLLQNDLTAATAEDAFLAYLRSLDGVARLEIAGLYTQNEKEDDGSTSTVVHVFGRTPDTPHVYYYRQLAAGVWTAWEKIEMEIEGDHLIPVTYNRRLYLFWPHFEEKSDADQSLNNPYIQSMEHYQWIQAHRAWQGNHDLWAANHAAWKAAQVVWNENLQIMQNAGVSDADIAKVRDQFSQADPWLDAPEPQEPREPVEPTRSSPPSLTHQEISLAWSEYREGKWSAKQTSSQIVLSPNVPISMEEYGTAMGITKETYPAPGSLELQWNTFLGTPGDPESLATKDTVVNIYVPEPEVHFFRTSIENGTGDLVIEVHRRYWHMYSFLGFPELPLKQSAILGTFRLACGAKVEATSAFQDLSFDALSRPDGAENDFMGFHHEGLPEAFSTTSNGKTLQVLKTLPDGGARYGIVHEPEYVNFTLPAQSFFFQDKMKTYFAHLQLESPVAALTRPDRIIPVFTMKPEEGLVAAFRPDLAGPVINPGLERTAIPAAAGAVPGGAATSAPAGAMVMDAPAPAVSLRDRSFSASAPMEMEKASSSSMMMEAATPSYSAVVSPSLIAAAMNMVSYVKFETFFHPHLCSFLKALYRSGVSGLVARSVQQLDNDPDDPKKNVFADLYTPAKIVDPAFPRENVDFSTGGAYSLYNWELFFHAPLMIAVSLGQNQQFEDAQAWFHYIFNPTTDSTLPSPQRYWNTLPFFQNDHPEKDRIQNLLAALDSTQAGDKALADEVRSQISAWREDPFNPHLIARMRITAYQKNVVMKYVDNLLQWGDQLFGQDTAEAINEAMLLYVLAHDILGPRPEAIPSHVKIDPKTYTELKAAGLDDFSNALVAFENEVPYIDDTPVPYMLKKSVPMSGSKQVKPGVSKAPVVKTAPETFYFSIPPNTQMLAYWDTVDDRLFKIRHGMNIEGVERSLSLFAPPIDPMLLVKAKAAGLDLGSVISDMAAPMPFYRFTTFLQKALEMCGELKSLGGALMSALEKKDGEALAALRAGQETAVLKAVKDQKKKQIDEANQTLEGLKRTQAVTQVRRDYYRDIVRINANEQSNLDSMGTAQTFNQISQGIAAGASAAHLVPDFHGGTSGGMSSPVVVASYGGSNVGSGIQAVATSIAMVASGHTHDAATASIMGGFDRRWDEWKMQEALANKEMDQIDSQIAAAEIRIAIAQADVDNQELQIENSQAIEDFYRTKYTGQDLYNWTIGQVSKVYFQAYTLAYGLAKKAEKAYRFELGLTDSDFIQFGYWDSLKKGLLTGEQLALDLKRLESSYLDKNARQLEVAKQVSLAALDPTAILSLKETGQCQVTLPEALFDMDYPGHYMRRIKSVSVTIPCVVGPYAGVNATLTLLTNEVRVDGNAQGAYPKAAPGDPRFVQDFASIQSVAVSHGQNDGGLFELNFRDERYLPFEGAGVTSTWRLELPPDFRPFDYDTISDVVLHLKYTARDGGALLKTAAANAAKAWAKDQAASPLSRLFSARHEFPNDWQRFLFPLDGATDQALSMDMGTDRFPFPFQGKTIGVNRMDVFLKLKDGFAYNDGTPLVFTLAKTNGPSFAGNALKNAGSPVTGLPYVTKTMQESPGAWTLTVKGTDVLSLPAALKKKITVNNVDVFRINPDAIDDLWVVCRYSASM